MGNIQKLKKKFYFIAAAYFRHFANRSLKRWNPKKIVLTGSAGKTTMLHLLEFEIGPQAHYSHNANSAFGISFDILGLDGIRGSKLKWLYLILAAPLRSLYYTRREPLYVIEIDGERPHEAEFLANWLKPDITLWISFGLSHASQFDRVVAAGEFASLEDAIAHEFSTLPAATKRTIYIDGDCPKMRELTQNLSAKVVPVTHSDLESYTVYPQKTEFKTKDTTFIFNAPEPRDIVTQLLMLSPLMKELKLPLKTDFAGLAMPAGRSNFFHGKNGLKLIDSSYNAHIISTQTILEMTKSLRAPHKWLVIGDIVDQGSIEAAEHAKLAGLILAADPEHVVLVGRRTKKYTYPILKTRAKFPVKSCADAREALRYLEKSTTGAETLIFKGSQYLEWIIEKLLADPADAKLLPRRESGAVKRRKAHGLDS